VSSLAGVINGFTSYESDRDTDGLLDKYEIYGVRTIAGLSFKTNPEDDDSDDDTLSDFEELGTVYDLNKYIGCGLFKNCRFVIPRSDPNNPDSDGDCKLDNEDPHPWSEEEIEVKLNNRYGISFLPVAGMKGGNQLWWPGTGKKYPGLLCFERYYDYVICHDYRVNGYGCGLIAMTDLELYLAQQNDYALSGGYILYSSDNPSISQNDYMTYAEYNLNYKYHLTDYAFNYFVGVIPFEMEYGIKNFYISNGEPNVSACWSPSCDKVTVIKTIERMIAENIPVVFSYHAFEGEDGIWLYKNIEDAKKDNRSANPIYSHYMNVIGYVKYFKNDNSKAYSYLLKVVSCGEIYYINYDYYAEHLSYFTNILEISL